MNFCDALSQYLSDFFQSSSLNIDWLEHTPDAFSVDACADGPYLLREYTTGKALYAFDFYVNARLCYGFDKDVNALNLQLWNDLSLWLRERSLNRILPQLPSNCSPQSVQALRPGYLSQAQDDGTGKYSMPCRLIYLC